MARDDQQDRPDFSVVICSRNRAAGLEPCLRAVSQLVYAGPWEIVLVDNASTDATSALLDRIDHAVIIVAIGLSIEV